MPNAPQDALLAPRIVNSNSAGTSASYSIRNDYRSQEPSFLLIEDAKYWGKPQLGNNELALKYSHTHRCASHQNM